VKQKPRYIDTGWVPGERKWQPHLGAEILQYNRTEFPTSQSVMDVWVRDSVHRRHLLDMQES